MFLKAVLRKLGGFAFPGGSGKLLVEEYVKLLKELVGEYQLVVVTGGGAVAHIHQCRSEHGCQ